MMPWITSENDNHILKYITRMIVNHLLEYSTRMTNVMQCLKYGCVCVVYIYNDTYLRKISLNGKNIFPFVIRVSVNT
jgi:hypothetical protein